MVKRPKLADQLVEFRAIVGSSVSDAVLTDCLNTCKGDLPRAVDMFFASSTSVSVPVSVAIPAATSAPLSLIKTSECIPLGSFNCIGGLTTKLAASANELYMDTPLDCSFSIRPPTSAPSTTPASLVDLIHGAGFIRFTLVAGSSPIGRLPAPIASALCPLVRLNLVEVAVEVGYPGCAGQHLPPGASVPIRVHLSLPPSAFSSIADDILNERIHACWSVLFAHIPHEEAHHLNDAADEKDDPVKVDSTMNGDDDVEESAGETGIADGALNVPDDTVNETANESVLEDLSEDTIPDEVIEMTVEMARFSELFARQDLSLTFPSSLIFPTMLKTYQAQALTWMIARESDTVESGADLPAGWLKFAGDIFYHDGVFSKNQPAGTNQCRGGILGDEMGLGKTVMTLALVSMDRGVRGTAGQTLIIVHLSLLAQWIAELQRHCPSLTFATFHGPGRPRDPVALGRPDVVFSTYGTLAADPVLLALSWRRVVLDEAHTIRTRGTKMARAVGRLVAERRWCLTGTPVQNSIEDIYPLIAWLRVPVWRSYAYFRKQILSEPPNISLAQSVLRPLMLRRTKATKDSAGQPLVTLPPRTSKVIYIPLSQEEKDFYRALFWQTKLEFDKFEKSNQVMYNMTHILQLIMRLRQALCHPSLCKTGLGDDKVSLDELLQKFMTTGQLAPGYVGNLMTSLAEGVTDCPICLDDPCQFPVVTPCGHTLCRKCCMGRPRKECPICRHVFLNTEMQAVPTDSPAVPLSSKLRVLIDYVQRDMRLGRKVVVFSQFVSFINIIGKVFTERDIPFRTLHGGHTPVQRQAAVAWLSTQDTSPSVRKYESPDDPLVPVSDHEEEVQDDKGRVLLVSLKAGGVGLNLVAANVVYLTDLWWNPAVEEQAFQRVHRLGQRRPVFTYKFVCSDTIDERILDLQAVKSDLTSDLLGDGPSSSEPSRSKKLSLDDIRQLFKPQ